MSRVSKVGRRTFSALQVPNYRRYFAGQAVSLVGTWMQSVAQSWLVYTITHSPTDIGLTVAVQTLPVLILGPYGGVIADRVDKRRLMIVLQAAMGVQALVLGILTVTGNVTFADVLVLAVILGLNNTFENPARQSFILEMVGGDEVRNAISLNSTLFNAARAVGPAVAGLLIATGHGRLFPLELRQLRGRRLLTRDHGQGQVATEPTRGEGEGAGEGGFLLRSSQAPAAHPLVDDGDHRHARVRVPGEPARRRQVGLPRRPGAGHGLMTAAIGAGAVIGGLITATRGKTGLRPFIIGSAALGWPSAWRRYPQPSASSWRPSASSAGRASPLRRRATPPCSSRASPRCEGASCRCGRSPSSARPTAGRSSDGSSQRRMAVGLAVGALACLVAAGFGAIAAFVISPRRQRTRKTVSPMGVSSRST